MFMQLCLEEIYSTTMKDVKKISLILGKCICKTTIFHAIDFTFCKTEEKVLNLLCEVNRISIKGRIILGTSN